MTIHVLPYWDIIVDALQIILCGIILIILIRNKLKYKQLILKTTPNDKSADFAGEILIQSLKQQTAKTFDAILDVINQERDTLQSYYETEEIDRCFSPFRMHTTASEKTIEKMGKKISADTNAADHGNILQLSESGLTSKQISQKVMAPREEVELVLRMNARMAEGETRNPL